MKKIKISRGFVSLVSDVDFKKVSKYKWTFCKNHARHSKLGLMHRFILNPPRELEIDHINGNGLDNRRENLRMCTPSQNRMNSKAKIGKSGYKGVCKKTGRTKWHANITLKGKKIFIGSYFTPDEAAKEYDKKAKELYGEFAYLNFPLRPRNPCKRTGN